MGVPKEGELSDKNAPPEVCIVNKQFIGEEKCRTLVDKKTSGESSMGGPPEECIVNGKFIGKEKCQALMEKKPSVQQEKTEQQETAIKKSFWQRVAGWFSSLFK